MQDTRVHEMHVDRWGLVFRWVFDGFAFVTKDPSPAWKDGFVPPPWGPGRLRSTTYSTTYSTTQQCAACSNSRDIDGDIGGRQESHLQG